MVSLPRLYAIADTATIARRGVGLEEAVEAMLDGGIRLVQLRHKGHYTRALYESAAKCAALCRGAGSALVIDDRADIACMLGAGLHVGQDDLPPVAARSLLGDGALLGYSTHNADQLLEADREPVDYLAIGPVFATTGKSNPDPVLGVERLRVLRHLTKKPLVAIGGITRENAASVFARGIDSVAVIGDLLCAGGASAIRVRVAEWLRMV